jgi:transcriptional regulator with XRE-family HTH domain
MSLASETAVRAQEGFGGELKFWRRQRRLSQLELALAAGVSQRHVSFLESGRAKPSRGMVLHLARTLEVPLRSRNELLLSSGFAPVYANKGLDDPALAIARQAMGFLLERHEPFPAIALDRNWTVIKINRGMSRMSSFLASGTPRDDLNFSGIDYLGSLVDPNGAGKFMIEGEPIIVALLEGALRDATSAQDKAAIARISGYLGKFDRVRVAEATPSSGPLPRVIFQRHGVRLSLVTIMTAFAAPCDATLEGLKLELFYPADATTQNVFDGWAK